MKLWIRIDTAIRSDPNVAELAARTGVTLAEAVGLCTLVWAAIAEHRPNGDLNGIAISALENWAAWEPRKGKPTGSFGTAFRELFITNDTASGWKNRQGKLVERAERDRLRKVHGSSEESRGDSTVTERNGTEQLPTTSDAVESDPAPVPEKPRTSRAKKGAIEPNEHELRVAGHYRTVHPKRGPLDDADFVLIRKRLVDFSPDQLCQAIDGNREDEWHRSRRKHELSYVLRNNGKVSEFIDRYDAMNAPLVQNGQLTEDGRMFFSGVTQ